MYIGRSCGVVLFLKTDYHYCKYYSNTVLNVSWRNNKPIKIPMKLRVTMKNNSTLTLHALSCQQRGWYVSVMRYLSLLWPVSSARYGKWWMAPRAAGGASPLERYRLCPEDGALCPLGLSGAQRGGTIDWSLTTIISSSFVTTEHELPLEVISEDLRLVNKGTWFSNALPYLAAYLAKYSRGFIAYNSWLRP